MDQKNTIVKCYAKPDCLFNHNGICDNYIIAIGEDGRCDCYVETKQCHPDCIHFDDSDMFVGPQCLFKHPEPLKDFYEDMPCEYYHKRRGQRATTSVARGDIEIDDELRERFKVFIDKWIKEHPPLSKEDQAIMNEIGYVPPKEEDQMCWYCDHGRSGRCSLTAKPMRDSNGNCGRFTSTGGNR